MSTRERDRDRELLIPSPPSPRMAAPSPRLVLASHCCAALASSLRSRGEKATPLLCCGIWTLPSSSLLHRLSMFQKLQDPGFNCSLSIRGSSALCMLQYFFVTLLLIEDI